MTLKDYKPEAETLFFVFCIGLVIIFYILLISIFCK